MSHETYIWLALYYNAVFHHAKKRQNFSKLTESLCTIQKAFRISASCTDCMSKRCMINGISLSNCSQSEN